jgi:hypothetical protein
VRDAKGAGPLGGALGAASQHPAHLDPDPSQRLYVDRPDEPRPDDGGADLGDGPHA